MKLLTLVIALSFISILAYGQNQVDNYEKALLLDVRTVAEYEKDAAPGSTNIPLNELSSRLAEISDKKEDKIVVYCQSGRRSAVAKEVLEANGFKNVVNGYTCQHVCKSLGLKSIQLTKL